MGPRTGLDGCGKSRPPTRIRSPDMFVFTSFFLIVGVLCSTIYGPVGVENAVTLCKSVCVRCELT